MSRPITQPINQVRLTNVAVVRMTKGGKRFEIACYRNKVVNYRQGLETDLSEVLQTERVFTNVSKGQFAKWADLQAVFVGTQVKEADICRIILEKGTVQVGDLERAEQLENVQREICTWIANHCVHAKTQRPFTMSQIRQAMQESNFVVHTATNRPLKRQYLDCIKSLQTVLELERAKMELSLLVPRQHLTKLQEQMNEWNIVLTQSQQQQQQRREEEEVVDADNESVEPLQFTLLVDPSMYRQLEELSKSLDGCQLQIIQQVVMNQDAVNLEAEVEQRHQQQQQQQTLQQDQSSTVNTDPNHVVSTTKVTDGRKVEHSKLENAANDTAAENDDDDDDEDADSDNETLSQQRKKNQRQNNKKSKKAKRREKEELSERQERLAAERQRRLDRGEEPAPQQRQQQQTAASATHDSNGSNNSSTVTSTTTETKSCNTCGGSFSTAADYRAHFRSDWHRFNQKLKLQGQTPISEQVFLLCDADMMLLLNVNE